MRPFFAHLGAKAGEIVSLTGNVLRNGLIHRNTSTTSLSKLPDLGLPDRYTPIRLLGRGATSKTWLCFDNEALSHVAIKTLRRPVPEELLPNLMRELTLHVQLAPGHPAIVDVYAVLITPYYVGLVLEPILGGTLLSYIHSKDGTQTVTEGAPRDPEGGARGPEGSRPGSTALLMSEAEACVLFKGVVEAVAYCHSRNCAHRDLKAENILLTDATPPEVRLADFGFAVRVNDADETGFLPGTRPYMAPQLLDPNDKTHDPCAADAWSCGVLLCVLLMGQFPFDHALRRDPAAPEAELDIWVQQQSRHWSETAGISSKIDQLSQSCRGLLDAALAVDEAARIKVQDMLQHPWLAETDHQATSACLAATAEPAQCQVNSTPTQDNGIALIRGTVPRVCTSADRGLAESLSSGNSLVNGTASLPALCTTSDVAQLRENYLLSPRTVQTRVADGQLQLLLEAASHCAGVREGDDYMHVQFMQPVHRTAHEQHVALRFECGVCERIAVHFLVREPP